MRRPIHSIAGAGCGASGGGTGFDRVVQDDAVVVVRDLGVVANSTARSMRPLRIGPASGSCKLTRRMAPSGVWPASPVRAWPAMASGAGDGGGQFGHCSAQPAPGPSVMFPVITGTTGRDQIFDRYPDVASNW